MFQAAGYRIYAAKPTRGWRAMIDVAPAVAQARSTVGSICERPTPVFSLGVKQRQIEIPVAGPSALLVAKLHKIAERVAAGKADRIVDKDALDVFRLLRGTDIEQLAAQFARLTRDSLAGAVTLESLGQLRDLFGTRDTPGTQMVVRGTAGVEDPTTTAASCEALANDLLAAITLN